MRAIHYIRITFLILFGSALFSALAFAATNQPIAALNTTQDNEDAKTISEIVSNGRFLILSDSTVWEVHPRDQIIAKGWLTPSVITIQEVSDATYPYRLKNEDTQSIIEAKKASIEEIYLFIEEEKANEEPSDLEQKILEEPLPNKQPATAPSRSAIVPPQPVKTDKP